MKFTHRINLIVHEYTHEIKIPDEDRGTFGKERIKERSLNQRRHNVNV